MNIRKALFWLISLYAGLASASDLNPQLNVMRQWTNHSGQTITAACLATNGERVRLVAASGQSYVYDVEKLSEVDQSYVAELWRRQNLAHPVTDATVRGESRNAGYAAEAAGAGKGHAAAKAKSLTASWDKSWTPPATEVRRDKGSVIKRRHQCHGLLCGLFGHCH